MKKAFITGIGGQDGSYLSEYLINKNYKVYGIIRRNSVVEHQKNRLENFEINKNIELSYGDVEDRSCLDNILKKIKPDEIYNLAAQSHVRISFDVPEYTIKTNALGVFNMLESFKFNSPKSKFYQASSSEMFGRSVDKNGYQRESTKFEPTSPYGCAKVFAFNLVKHYRFAYKLFCSNGILFNHESPRRGSNFVTNKVIKSAVEIKLGLKKKLYLGNLDSFRDWGHSKDYIRAMHLILKHNKPDDFVIATGQTRSIRQLCKIVFDNLNLDYKKYVKQQKKFLRPEELKYLKGDSSKARRVLNWKPEISFEQMINEMTDFWVNYYDKKI
jgi:GDPmannose 4,6-dehydratase